MGSTHGKNVHQGPMKPHTYVTRSDRKGNKDNHLGLVAVNTLDVRAGRSKQAVLRNSEMDWSVEF